MYIIVFSTCIIISMIALSYSRELKKMLSLSIPYDKLKEKGWKVYVNTYNCGWCAKQVEFFGTDLNRVEVVHCDNLLNEDCKKMTALPTWVDKDGNEVHGALLTRDTLIKKLNL